MAETKELTAEQLAAKVEALEKKNEKLAKDKEKLTGLLDEANETNRALSATKGNKNPVVSHEGNKYQTMHAVRWVATKGKPAVVVMPDQMPNHPKLIAFLVEKRSTALQLVN